MRTRVRWEAAFAVFAVLLLVTIVVPAKAWAVDYENAGYWDRWWNGSGVERQWKTERAEVLDDIDSSHYTLSGWYVVKEDFTDRDRPTVRGTVNIIFKDGATMHLRNGINVPPGATLNIYAGGNAESGKFYVGRSDADTAAIGGNKGQSSGTINIHSGTVEVKGGSFTNNGGAGIGGGGGASGGQIRVYGGTITARGGNEGAGIGGGSKGTAGNVEIYGGNITAEGFWGAGIGGGQKANGGNIKIFGGNITAKGGADAAGIGGGEEHNGGNVTISGGNVTATGGSVSSKGGAGIGGGGKGGSGSINITGGTVKATGGAFASGIGGGDEGEGNGISISGGNVTAIANTQNSNGGGGGAGIGGGDKAHGKNITISGGTVSAQGGTKLSVYGGAGIGGGSNHNGENITISGTANIIKAQGAADASGIGGGNGGEGKNIKIVGGTVNAHGGSENSGGGAGIGGGQNKGGEIEITGGNVTATGGADGAGIGGGENGTGGTITITGGIVKATGGKEGAGIGSGEDALSAGTILIAGNARVTAQGGSEGAGIGGGWCGGRGGSVTIKGGYVDATGGWKGAGIGSGRWFTNRLKGSSNYANATSVTIEEGAVVNAKGGLEGAGIGGGDGGPSGKITINGGAVIATGGTSGGAGIGSGTGCEQDEVTTVDITINGGNVTAYAGPMDSNNNNDKCDPGAAIGTGAYMDAGTKARTSINSYFVGEIRLNGGNVTAYAADITKASNTKKTTLNVIGTTSSENRAWYDKGIVRFNGATVDMYPGKGTETIKQMIKASEVGNGGILFTDEEGKYQRVTYATMSGDVNNMRESKDTSRYLVLTGAEEIEDFEGTKEQKAEYKRIRVESVHKHDFEYSLKEGTTDTIVAECVGKANCPLPNGKAELQIVAPEHKMYGDGKAESAVIIDKNKIKGDATVKYYAINTDGSNNETYYEEAKAPINPGRYRAAITLPKAVSDPFSEQPASTDSATAYVDYVISKASCPSAVSTTLYIKAGESVNLPDEAGKLLPLGDVTNADYINYEVQQDKSTASSDNYKLDATSHILTTEDSCNGRVVVRASVAADNYRDSMMATITVVVEAKPSQIIEAQDVTYAIDAENPKIVATVSGGTSGNEHPPTGALSYSLKNDPWGENAADVIDVNSSTGELKLNKVGTAYVTVTAAGTSEYATTTKDVKVTVTKKGFTPEWTEGGWIYGDTANPPTINSVPEGVNVYYEYKTKDADDYYYDYDVPTNAGTYVARATVEETDEYGSVTYEKEFTVAKRHVNAQVYAMDKYYDGTAEAYVIAYVGDVDTSGWGNWGDGDETDGDGYLSGQTVGVQAAGDDGDETNEDSSSLVVGDSIEIWDLTGQFASENASDEPQTVTVNTETADATITGTNAENYEVTIPTTTTATIYKAPVMIVANDAEKAYDKNPNNPAPSTFTAAIYGFDDLLAALLDDDTGESTGSSSDLGWPIDYTLSRDAGEEVGTYAINVNVTEGAPQNANYDITSIPGTFTITKGHEEIKPVVTITGWTYGNTPNAPTVVEGTNPGDGEVTFEYKAADADDYEYTKEVPTQPGKYVVRATVEGITNYNGGTSDPVEFEIAKKHVTATVIADDKTYDGTTHADVYAYVGDGIPSDNDLSGLSGLLAANSTIKTSSNDGVSLFDVQDDDGLVGDDWIVILGLEGEFENKNAGENKTVYVNKNVSLDNDASDLIYLGEGTENYEVEIPATSTATITKATATIMVDDATKKQGEDDPAFTATVSGTIGDDALTYTLSREAGNEVGEYAITATAKPEDNPNYDITCEPGKLTIAQGPLSVTAQGYSGVYDGNPHGISVSVKEADATVYYATQVIDADSYQTSGATTTPVTRTDAGTTTVYYLVVAPSGDMATGSQAIQIAKAKGTETNGPKATNPLYNGQPRALVTTPTLPDGYVKAQYSTNSGASWSDAIPVGVNAGDYVVSVKYVGDSNHEDFRGEDVAASIRKAPCPVSVAGTATVVTGGNTVDLSQNVNMHGAEASVRYVIDGDANDCRLEDGILTSGKDSDTAKKVAVKVLVTADSNHEDTEETIIVTVVNKTPQTIEAADVSTTYGATDAKVTARVIDPKTDGGAIRYSVKGDNNVNYWDYIDVDSQTGDLMIKAVPADGKAYVTVTASETKTHAQATKDVTITINKAASTAATVTAKNGTYDGTEQPLVEASGEVTGGEMQYVLGSETEPGETYSTTVPAATNAGVYYVWSKVAGDGNYGDTEPQCTKVTIARRALIVEPSAIDYDRSKFYGEVDPEFEYGAVGFADGDTKESVLTGKLSREPGENAGQYEILQGTLAANQNYNIEFRSNTFTIKAKPVTAEVHAEDKVYDGTTDATVSASVKASDLVNENDVVAIYGLTGTFESAEVGTHKVTIATGTYGGPLTSGKDWMNYDVSLPDPAETTASITASNEKQKGNPATVTAKDRTYDGSKQPLVEISGIPGGYTVQYSTDGGANWSPEIPEATNAGKYTVFVKYVANNEDTHITFRGADVPVTIAKAGINATINPTTATVITGGNTVDLATNVDLSGNINDDTEAIVRYAINGEANDCTIDGSVLKSGTNSDTSKTVKVNVTITKGDNYNKLTYDQPPITVTVTDKAPQTIEASDVAVAYGETNKTVEARVTDPATDGGEITYVVKAGSESYLAVDRTSGTLTVKAVPANGEAYITATASETQTHAQTTKDVKVTISQVASTAATVAPKDRTYDGTEQALVAVTASAAGGQMRYALGDEYQANVANEDFSPSIPTAKDAGIYHVWYLVEGDANHSSTQPQRVAVTIARRQVSVYGITAQSKDYDGTTDATLGYGSMTLSGKVQGDDLSATATGTFVDANAGANKAVTISNIALAGEAAGNYVLGSGQQELTIATIRKLSVSASATARSKEYDGTTEAEVSATVEVPGGNKLEITGLKSAFADANVGTGKAVSIDATGMTVSGQGSENYNVVVPKSTTGEIYARHAVVKADDKTKTPGQDDPKLTATVIGALDGDTLSYTLSCTHEEKEGTYEIVVTQGENPNYNVTYMPGKLTISAVAVEKQPQTITATGVSTTYGATDAQITATTDGDGAITYAVKPGSEDYIDVDASSGKLTIKAVPPSGVAYVTATAAETDAYKAVSADNIEVKIAKKPIGVDATVTNKVYDGTTSAEFKLSVKTENLVEGDQVVISGVTGAFDSAEAGERTVRLNTGSMKVTGKNSGYYAISVPVTANATILPRPATVTADDKSRPLGASDPALTATVTGTVGNDILAYELSCTHEETAGTYDINVIPGTNPNYDVNYVKGRLTITNANISVSAAGYTGVYDGKPHGITVDVTPAGSGATVYYSEQELTNQNYQTVGSTTPVTRTDAGTANVKFLVVAPNGEMIAGNKDIAITKAGSALTKAPEGRELKWNGAAQELVVAGTAEGGTLQYSLDGENWSNSVPTATDPGFYFVAYRVEGDANHEGVAADYVLSAIYAEDEPFYVVYEGDYGIWTKGEEVSEGGLPLTFKRYYWGEDGDTTYAHFRSASVDGTQLKEGTQYTKRQGSVIITLLPEYLDGLAEGVHTLTANFDDGESEAVFYVAESTKPEPDPNPTPAKVTVSFDGNGGIGSMDNQTVDVGDSVTLPANKFTRSGYTFAGWNTRADGSGASYKDGAGLTPATDLTLYAQWNATTTTTTGEGTTSSGTGTTTTTSGDGTTTTSSGGGTTTTTSDTTSGKGPTARTGDPSLPFAAIGVLGAAASFIGLKRRR